LLSNFIVYLLNLCGFENHINSKGGLTGFDSGMNRNVSTQSVGRRLYNLNFQTITGENNFALAA